MKKMRRYIVVLVFLLPFLFLCSCAAKAESKLSYMSSPFMCNVVCTMDSKTYELEISALSRDNYEVKFTEPENLDGFSFICENGEMSVYSYGVSIPLTKGEYTETVYGLMDYFYPDVHSVSDMRTTENSGMNVCVMTFGKGDKQTVLYIDQERMIPLRAEGMLGGRETVIKIRDFHSAGNDEGISESGSLQSDTDNRS